MRKRTLILMMAVLAIAYAQPAYGATEVTLDHVDGLAGPGQIKANTPITFHIRYTYTPGNGSAIIGSSNGFRVYSQSGATWQPITWDTASIGWSNIYDGGVFMAPRSVTGSGADTIGLGGFAMFSQGMRDPFDKVVFNISTEVDENQVGKNLCLDSCFYPPNQWLWNTNGPMGAFYPPWDGPHCFSIVPGCPCGDITDCDGEVNIMDLTWLVAYLFTGGPPPDCIPGD
ncbi:MAG: hypothetical protein KOO62_11935 [candidate division Zixibacteria bacterium]|nr:hypothetical protein [candidate division Zixibacteria bacterium]